MVLIWLLWRIFKLALVEWGWSCGSVDQPRLFDVGANMVLSLDYLCCHPRRAGIVCRRRQGGRHSLKTGIKLCRYTREVKKLAKARAYGTRTDATRYARGNCDDARNIFRKVQYRRKKSEITRTKLE